jgi:hypothetical protein
MLSMRTFVVAAAVVATFFVIAALRAEQTTPTVVVVRDPGCGCCLSWVQHLQRAGFKTTVTESAQRIQNTPSVPASARSCHTATVDGYLVEGHVPVADIKRLAAGAPQNCRHRGAGNAIRFAGDGSPERRWSRRLT